METLDKTVPVIAVLVGSDSDLPRIAECIEKIQSSGIQVIPQAISAHRRPEALAEFGQNLPEVILPEEVADILGGTRLRAACVIAAAGCSAHIAGALAANTVTPVIALPVESSAGGTVDASLSMMDMPPGIPNGFVPNNAIAAAMATKLFKLEIPAGYNGIAVSDAVRANIDVTLLARLGLRIDEESPITIGTQDIDFSQGSDAVSSDKIHIIIPTTSQQLTNGNTGSLGKIKEEGFYMPLQKAEKVNTMNAILFAAQILGSHNPDIRAHLEGQRKENANKLALGNIALVSRDVPRIVAIEKLRSTGLWPANKTMNTSRGHEELESLGYVRFYTGKNADLYIIPHSEPLQTLIVRTDRTSVFDIPLDLQVEGKGAIQNQIALLGADFARKHDIKTTNYDLPSNIPDSLRERCQAVELCKPLEVQLEDGTTSGVELILRNYLTGSLLKAYRAGEDPYGINLPTGKKEWDSLKETGLPLFTPTTKDKNDTPVNSELVRSQYPDIIRKLQELFKEFTDFMYEKGYVVVDTKFEVFINSKGEWCLGDEILTPESSRFIKREDFEAGNYISADKQIIRNLGEEFGWKEKWKVLKQTTPNAKLLPIAHEVPDTKKKEVLAGYQSVHDAMKVAA